MYVAKRIDGTFETLVNGFPYHVLADDPLFPDLFADYTDLPPGMAEVDGVVMEDNRGKSGWRGGESFTMTDFGPLPEGFSTVPPLTRQAKAFEINVEKWLDAFARTRSYKDIVTAASYATSKNEHFKAEAGYAADLRDRTWEWANGYMNAVLSGQRGIPTWEAFEAELTAAVRPAWPVQDTRVGM